MFSIQGDLMNDFNESYVGLRSDLLKYIEGKSLNILDVGCATGINGRYLKDNDIASFVVGIEYDENMAIVAQQNIDKVIIADLNNIDIRSDLFGNEFDYIVLGDILEHLIDPCSFLKNIAFFLKRSGNIIISIPNVQHIETFIQLYFHGTWPCRERGIFDKTHLRFFTYKNILNLIEKSNLSVLDVERKFRYRDAVGSRFPKYMGAFLRRMFPNLFTFQYIVICKRDGQVKREACYE